MAPRQEGVMAVGLGCAIQAWLETAPAFKTVMPPVKPSASTSGSCRTRKQPGLARLSTDPGSSAVEG